MISEYLEAIITPVLVFLGFVIVIFTFIGSLFLFVHIQDKVDYTSNKHSADLYNRQCNPKVKLKPYDFDNIYVDWRTCKIKNKWSSND